MRNSLVANVSPNAWTAFGGWNPAVNDSNALTEFTLQADGIVALVGGKYEVDCSIYHTGGGAREHIFVQAGINGTVIAANVARGGGGYIRQASSQFETTAFYRDVLTVVAGDKIGIFTLQGGSTSGTAAPAPAGFSFFRIERVG